LKNQKKNKKILKIKMNCRITILILLITATLSYANVQNDSSQENRSNNDVICTTITDLNVCSKNDKCSIVDNYCINNKDKGNKYYNYFYNGNSRDRNDHYNAPTGKGKVKGKSEYDEYKDFFLTKWYNLIAMLGFGSATMKLNATNIAFVYGLIVIAFFMAPIIMSFLGWCLLLCTTTAQHVFLMITDAAYRGFHGSSLNPGDGAYYEKLKRNGNHYDYYYLEKSKIPQWSSNYDDSVNKQGYSWK
jgi:hypothetical protein